MDQSQSLSAPPFFDGSNYAFWKVRMRAFLCAIDESVWDSVENGYVKPTTPKSEWDKATLALANANSKARSEEPRLNSSHSEISRMPSSA